MLDSYIIDEIKRREDERRRKEEQRPRVEIPIIPHPEDADTNPAKHDDDSPPRGVVIIDYSV